MFRTLKDRSLLCKPAKFYLYLSLAGLVMSIIQNIRKFDNKCYKCGSFSVLVPSVLMIFAFKIVYIAFWTYVLNLLCRDNNIRLAWILVLFPFILFFVILGLLLITGGVEDITKEVRKEGFTSEDEDALMTSDTKMGDESKEDDKEPKKKTPEETQ